VHMRMPDFKEIDGFPLIWDFSLKSEVMDTCKVIDTMDFRMREMEPYFPTDMKEEEKKKVCEHLKLVVKSLKIIAYSNEHHVSLGVKFNNGNFKKNYMGDKDYYSYIMKHNEKIAHLSDQIELVAHVDEKKSDTNVVVGYVKEFLGLKLEHFKGHHYISDENRELGLELIKKINQCRGLKITPKKSDVTKEYYISNSDYEAIKKLDVDIKSDQLQIELERSDGREWIHISEYDKPNEKKIT